MATSPPGEPVTLSRDTLLELASMMGRNQGPSSQSANTSSGSGGGSSVNWSALSDKVGVVGGAVITNFDKVARGTATTADAFTAVTGIVKSFPGFGTVGKAVDMLGANAIDTAKSMRETGRAGITMGGDLTGFNAAVKGAQLTFPEFEAQVRRGSEGIAGLSSNMDKSAKAYLGVMKDVQESEAGIQLKKAGVSAEELAQVTQLSMSRKRTFDFEDEKSRIQARDSAIALATEMNEVAKITGKSKEAQIAGIKSQLDKAEVEATLTQRGNAYRDQFEKMQASLGALGPSVQNLASEIASGGVRTKEGTAQLAALGPAGQQLQRAVLAQEAAAKSGSKEAKDAALREVELAKLAVIKYQQSDQYLEAVKTDTSEVGLQRRKQFMEARAASAALESSVKQVEEKAKKEGRKLTPDEIAKEARQLQKQEVTDITTGTKRDASGKAVEDTSQALFRTTNNMDNALKVAGGAIARSVDSTVKESDKLTAGLGKLNNLLDRTPTTGSMQNVVRSLPGQSGVGVDSESATPGRTPGTPYQRRDVGSKAATGNWFEDFGAGKIMELHKREAVVPEAKVPEFMKDMMAKMPIPKQPTGMPSPDVMKDMMAKLPIPKETNTIGPNFFNDMMSKIVPPKDKAGAGAMPDFMKDMMSSLPMNASASQKAPPIDMNAMVSKMTKNMPSIKAPNPSELASGFPMGGDLFGSLRTSISSATSSLAKKPEAPAPVVQPAPVQTAPPVRGTTTASENVQDAMLTQLNMLNKNVMQLIAHSAESVSLSTTQLRATKGLSGNRLG